MAKVSLGSAELQAIDRAVHTAYFPSIAWLATYPQTLPEGLGYTAEESLHMPQGSQDQDSWTQLSIERRGAGFVCRCDFVIADQPEPIADGIAHRDDIFRARELAEVITHVRSGEICIGAERPRRPGARWASSRVRITDSYNPDKPEGAARTASLDVRQYEGDKYRARMLGRRALILKGVANLDADPAVNRLFAPGYKIHVRELSFQRYWDRPAPPPLTASEWLTLLDPNPKSHRNLALSWPGGPVACDAPTKVLP